MKYTVKIDDQRFEVEILDIHARPIVAKVDGEPFEIWPETENLPRFALSSPAQPRQPLGEAHEQGSKAGKISIAAPQLISNCHGNAVRAPIPGTVISVAVKPGDQVTIGQELCVLEAMKMKNVIRSPRAGIIAVVVAQAGNIVKHHDLLIEYME